MSLDLSIIKNLKAAGEEVKKAALSGSVLDEASINVEGASLLRASPLGQDIEESSLFQKMRELEEEQAALEKTREKIKKIEKKLEERIEFLKSLRIKGIEISRGLKEFEQQLALARKDSSAFESELKFSQIL